MSSNTRYDFQQALNQFERDMMTAPENPGRVGVSIQIKKDQNEVQDDYAPTRGGNPYLAKGSVGMNCFCRLVIDDDDRKRKCDALEGHLKRRVDSHSKRDTSYCCRCHMGVSNFIFPFNATAVYQSSHGPGAQIPEHAVELAETEWYVFIGQFLCSSESKDKKVADALVIESPPSFEQGVVLPYKHFSDADHFHSPETLSSLSPTPDKRLHELYGKSPSLALVEHGISVLSESQITVFRKKVEVDFAQWLKAQVETHKELFQEAFAVFRASRTTSHCIEGLSEIAGYLDAWQRMPTIQTTQKDYLKSIGDGVRNLKLSLEESKSAKGSSNGVGTSTLVGKAPKPSTLRAIGELVTDFKKPDVSLRFWHQRLLAVSKAVADDFNGEDSINWAARQNLTNSAARPDFGPCGKLTRLLAFHPSWIGMSTAFSWTLCAGVFINLLTNVEEFRTTPAHIFMMVASLISAGVGYFLGESRKHYDAHPTLFVSDSSNEVIQGRVHQSFAADIWIESSQWTRRFTAVWLISLLVAIASVIWFTGWGKSIPSPSESKNEITSDGGAASKPKQDTDKPLPQDRLDPEIKSDSIQVEAQKR